jgi:hypothetical protein
VNDRRISVRDLGLSLRALNALEADGILHADQISEMWEAELLRVRGVGRLAFKEICVALDKAGLSPPKRFARAREPKFVRVTVALSAQCHDGICRAAALNGWSVDREIEERLEQSLCANGDKGE